MRKHAKEASRYKTDSRLCRQTEESFRQSDKYFGQECRQAVENSGVLPGRGVRCAAPRRSAVLCCAFTQIVDEKHVGGEGPTRL